MWFFRWGSASDVDAQRLVATARLVWASQGGDLRRPNASGPPLLPLCAVQEQLLWYYTVRIWHFHWMMFKMHNSNSFASGPNYYHEHDSLQRTQKRTISSNTTWVCHYTYTAFKMQCKLDSFGQCHYKIDFHVKSESEKGVCLASELQGFKLVLLYLIEENTRKHISINC